MKSILSKYLLFPFIIDGIVVTLIILFGFRFRLFDFEVADKATQLNILSNLISASVSLTGFILAALTIIVTFKSNLRAKGMEESQNALELIFSSKHYLSIVQVFKDAIIELVVTFSALFLIWSSAENLSKVDINKINVAGIYLVSAIMIRSLLLLFNIIDLEKHVKEE